MRKETLENSFYPSLVYSTFKGRNDTSANDGQIFIFLATWELTSPEHLYFEVLQNICQLYWTPRLWFIKKMLACQSYYPFTKTIMETARLSPRVFSLGIQRFMCGPVRELSLWSAVSSSTPSPLPFGSFLVCFTVLFKSFRGPVALLRLLLSNMAATTQVIYT